MIVSLLRRALIPEPPETYSATDCLGWLDCLPCRSHCALKLEPDTVKNNSLIPGGDVERHSMPGVHYLKKRLFWINFAIGRSREYSFSGAVQANVR